MRLLVTGGTGVLGRALKPQAEEAGLDLRMPGSAELDLYDRAAVADAVKDADAVLHLATRIRTFDMVDQPAEWADNDRLRTEAARNLVDASLQAGVAAYVQPTIAFVYPEDGPTTEDTPIGEVTPIMRSALVAEQETQRFADAGRRGVVLRFGLLDGPHTGNDKPLKVLGSTTHVADAAHALLDALTLPSGIYNVVRDGERVSNERFTSAVGWHPEH